MGSPNSFFSRGPVYNISQLKPDNIFPNVNPIFPKPTIPTVELDTSVPQYSNGLHVPQRPLGTSLLASIILRLQLKTKLMAISAVAMSNTLGVFPTRMLFAVHAGTSRWSYPTDRVETTFKLLPDLLIIFSSIVSVSKQNIPSTPAPTKSSNVLYGIFSSTESKYKTSQLFCVSTSIAFGKKRVNAIFFGTVAPVTLTAFAIFIICDAII